MDLPEEIIKEDLVEKRDLGIQSGNQKKDKQRSASYPSLSVLKAYTYAEKINEKFGNSEFTREEFAHLIGVHPNTTSRDIASCVQYKFLEKKEAKGTYKISELFNDIFRPESEKDKQGGLIQAFSNPKLYHELIEKFDGNVIPEELPNTLIKHHGITAAASKDAADTFIASAIEVGVFDRKMLKYTIVKGATAKTQYAEVVDVPNEENGERIKEQEQSMVVIKKPDENTTDVKVPIHLTKNKAAYLQYPLNTSAKDIKLLEHAIQGILLRLSLENDDDE